MRFDIIKNKPLTKEKDWKKFVESIKTDFKRLETNKSKAKKAIKENLIEAIKKRAGKKQGVLFSGGIDSTLIALILKRQKQKFTCYTVGLKNSQDILYAKKVAKELNLKLKIKITTLNEFEKILKNVVNILKEADVMKVGVASVLYASLDFAKKDKIENFFSGLGSEEIFAGYKRHEIALKNNYEAVHKECFNGLKTMWKRDLLRDFLISKHFNVNLALPFLDENIIKTAMKIHPKYKINKKTKKIIIREIAQDLGLKKEFAQRKKKAAQYGSNFHKAMKTIAKRNGFRLRKDYLRSLIYEEMKKEKLYPIEKVAKELGIKLKNLKAI